MSFSVDPNFRAWTQGTQRLLWNAIVGPDPPAFGAAAPAGSKARAAAEKAAPTAARRLPDARLGHPDPGRRRGCGRDGQDPATATAPRSSGIDVGGEVLFLVANRKDLSYEEHPFFGLVVRDLEKAGITTTGGQPAVAARPGVSADGRRADAVPPGRWTARTVLGYHPATCRVHTFYALESPQS